MSWFTYCAPTKNSGLVASTARPARATATPCQCRRCRNSPTPRAQAMHAGPSRTAKTFTPNTAIAAWSSQYSSGGLWKNGNPFSRGTSASPRSISKATVA